MDKLRAVITFALIDVKRTFRDKTGLFFIFVFPLIFLFVFGGLFGGSNDVQFKVALITQANNEFTKNFVKGLEDGKIIQPEKETNQQRAEERLQRGEVDAIVTLPKTFGEQASGQSFPSGQAKILVDQNQQQAGQTLASVLDGVFTQINKDITKAPTPFSVSVATTAQPGMSQFDYTFAGLLGFTLLSLGVFGPTSVFPRLKQQGILRRYHTTTLRVWQFFTANVLSQMVVGVLSVALMFAVALSFPMFDLNMRGDYVSLLVVILLGTATMFGIGLAVGGWAKNENQAAPLGNIISFPMMFLSGTFFPRFLMPDWLQNISALLPLTPINDAIRLITTEGQTLFQLGPQLALIVGWMVVIYVIAFRVFRWE